MDALVDEEDAAEVLGEVDRELLHRHAAGDDLVGELDETPTVAVGDRVRELVEVVQTDEPEFLTDLLERDGTFGEAHDLIEERVRVAQRAGRLLRDPEERLIVGVDRHLRGDLGELRLHLVNGNEAEVELLAARTDRRRNLVDLRRREDEDDVRRRLLDRLEQRVERAVTEHVDFVDDVDLVPSRGGREEHLVLDLAHVVDRRVRRAVDLDYIDRRSPGDLLAAGILLAAVGARSVGTVQRAGEDPRGARLPDTTRAGEEVCVRDAPGGQRILQACYYEFLSDERVKRTWPFPCRSYFVVHEFKKTPLQLEPSTPRRPDRSRTAASFRT